MTQSSTVRYYVVDHSVYCSAETSRLLLVLLIWKRNINTTRLPRWPRYYVWNMYVCLHAVFLSVINEQDYSYHKLVACPHAQSILG